MTNKHTELPLLAKGNIYDNDGFPCVVDSNECVVFSVWDEGRTIEQAERLAVDIASAVNYNHRLREALENLLIDYTPKDGSDYRAAKDATALLTELDNLENGS